MFKNPLKDAAEAAGKYLDRRQRASATLTETREKITALESELDTHRGALARAEARAVLGDGAEGLEDLRKRESEARTELDRLQALAGGLESELQRSEAEAAASLSGLNKARSEHAETERGKLAEKIRAAFESVTPLLRQMAAWADGANDALAADWIQSLRIPDPTIPGEFLFTGQPQQAIGGALRPVPAWAGDASAEKTFERERAATALAEQLERLAAESHQRQSTERRRADEVRPRTGAVQVTRVNSKLAEGEEEPRPAPATRPMMFSAKGQNIPLSR